jgi:hypothetical protein
LGVLALLITLQACVPEPEAPKIELTESGQLAKVRTWFEENKTKLRLPERGSNLRSESQELILPFFEKEPDWDKFHHYYFPDGREVFEISLENATKYFPTSMLESFPNRNPADVIIQNIMFIKHPTQERFDPVIARYYPENSGSVISFEEMNYLSIDYDWSGTIEMFTYDERHFVGFTIREGEIVENYTLKNDQGEKRISTANMDVRCHTTYHPVGYQVCVGGTCHTTIERYIAQTSCSGSSGIDNSEYFSIPRKEDDNATPTTDGTGGGCSSCEYDPLNMPGPNNFVDFQFNPNPGIKDYTKMSKTQIFLHLLNHLKKSKDKGESLDLRKIFTNFPQYADGNSPIQTAEAKLLVNGISYTIYFEYGVKDSWNVINSFPNLRSRGNNMNWEFSLHNSTSLFGALIVIPNEIHDVFLKFWY